MKQGIIHCDVKHVIFENKLPSGSDVVVDVEQSPMIVLHTFSGGNPLTKASIISGNFSSISRSQRFCNITVSSASQYLKAKKS